MMSTSGLAGQAAYRSGEYASRSARTSSLAGWGCGVLFDIPRLPLIALVALVAGAILSNTMVTELGEEDAGRLAPFTGGAVLYAVLLLLAH